MQRLPSAATFALAVLFANCTAPPAAGGSDPVDALKSLIAADGRRDLDAALACYTPDVVWLPPGAAEVRGRDAVAARYRTMFASYEPRLDIDVVEQDAAGDLAFVRGITRGELRPRGPGDAVAVHDAFVALLRRADGTWRITHLMWHATP